MEFERCMMKLSDHAKKMIRTICILLFILVVAGVVYYRSWSCLPFVFGALLGAAVSILKVLLLERAVDKALAMEEKAAGNYVRLQHLLRLLLTAVVLVLAALVPAISLWGAAAGVFTFQISVYILKFSLKS
ncbi:MAG: ATP synthase subunit I [Christensenellales bacterium]|jgi:hypothetical protein